MLPADPKLYQLTHCKFLLH